MSSAAVVIGTLRVKYHLTYQSRALYSSNSFIHSFISICVLSIELVPGGFDNIHTFGLPLGNMGMLLFQNIH